MRLVEILLMTLGGIWQGIRQDWNLLEIALIVVGAWAWQKKGWRPAFRWSIKPRRPWLWALGIAGGAVALRLALIPLLPIPIPIVTDEFSHLLLADTLLHGRLANPTHPFWPHFESIHIIQQPHYASNYFPGHALLLALGRLVIGSAWAGVLAESFVFLLALYWALRGWLPPRWAVFGVLLAALRFAIGSYWVNAYHGGFLPAIGGAVVAGAFPRLRERASAGNALALGTGLAILAGTRPFEGLFVSAPFLAVLAWHYRRRWQSFMKIALPAAAPVAIVLAGLGVYFSQVTGSPVVTTYQISQRTYGWPMALAWRTPPTVLEPNSEMQDYYDYEIGEHERVSGPLNMLEYATFRLQEYWRFFLGPALTIPLVMLGRVWRRRGMLLAGVCGGLAAILMEGASSPHYLAPATALIVAIVVECCRYLHAARSRTALQIVPLLPATLALVLGLRIGAQSLHLPYTQALNFQSWCCRVQGNLNKSRITAELDRIPGSHLVFVEPKTSTANLFQWVYNDADIDHARIVWARDLGPARNAELESYFSGRKVWRVNPNVEPAGLESYDAAASSVRAAR